MNKNNFLGGKLLQKKYLIFVFIAVATLMVVSALIELRNSRNELLDLMEEQAHSLLETILITSDNALLANEYLNNLVQDRLIDEANSIRMLYDDAPAGHNLLQDLTQGYQQSYRVYIFNSTGELIYSGDQGRGAPFEGTADPTEILLPIFSGARDTLVVGMRQAQDGSGVRYIIALSTEDNHAVVLNMDAGNIREFRQQIGFGSLMRKYTDNPEIRYVALQNFYGIIAASGNIPAVEPIEDSDFLTQSLTDSTFMSRVTMVDSLEVFEAVHPFYYRNDLVGVFRLGLSMEPLNLINARIYRRIGILTIVLLGIGFITFAGIFIRQNMQVLERQYQVVETYSNNIIQRVGDGIIVFDNNNGIKVYNRAAKELFQRPADEVIGEPLESLLDPEQCGKILSSVSTIREMSCVIRNRRRYLLVSRNTFTDEYDVDNTILVIRDLTEQKNLEAQIQRKERLSAMGELASGVAHEIRNPLNTIGTIVQQLKSDFEPKESSKEFYELNSLVYKEVKRINKTIQDFLRFSRPEAMNVENFSLDDLVDQMKQQYEAMAREKSLQLIIDQRWNGQVLWDRNQIQQVLMNLIQNAMDAVESGGKIRLTLQEIDEYTLEIKVSDNGPGIPEEIRNKIFNLYYTTKPQGTGIGLSMVQRIIDEHGGVITLESEIGSGTSFTIRMPKKVSMNEQVTA